MKFIENARAVWAHYSTVALATLTGLGGTWAGLPEGIKSALPSWVAQVVGWTVFTVAVLGLGGKFIDQTPKEPPKE